MKGEQVAEVIFNLFAGRLTNLSETRFPKSV